MEKALFLDRDGVINCRLPGDYVKTPEDLSVFDFAGELLPVFKKYFDRIFIVTNQQGIGKKLMTELDLWFIHQKMLAEIDAEKKLIDAIYFCPHLAQEKCSCRKPSVGMALKAKNDFPKINFAVSLMVGDSSSDILFGKNAGMKTIAVGGLSDENADFTVKDLTEIVLIFDKFYL
jgi:histidinol-phosphate phosphatase family protein